MDTRSFQYPKIVFGEHKVVWKESIKYLEVQLVWGINFDEHLQIATVKAIQCGANLAWLMPNIGVPREAKRWLVKSVMYSKLFYVVCLVFSISHTVPEIIKRKKKKKKCFFKETYIKINIMNFSVNCMSFSSFLNQEKFHKSLWFQLCLFERCIERCCLFL